VREIVNSEMNKLSTKDKNIEEIRQNMRHECQPTVGKDEETALVGCGETLTTSMGWRSIGGVCSRIG